jgi:hypothetical protein
MATDTKTLEELYDYAATASDTQAIACVFQHIIHFLLEQQNWHEVAHRMEPTSSTVTLIE